MNEAYVSHLPASHCPRCNYKIDAATCVDEAGNEKDIRPKVGDVTICLKCGQICAFREDLTLRLPTDAELEGISTDHMRLLSKIQWAIRYVRKSKEEVV